MKSKPKHFPSLEESRNKRVAVRDTPLEGLNVKDPDEMESMFETIADILDSMEEAYEQDDVEEFREKVENLIADAIALRDELDNVYGKASSGAASLGEGI